MSAAAILDAGAHAVVAKRLAPGPKRRDNEARFWSKVEKTDGCWLWRAGLDEDGYGKFAITLPRGSRPKQRHVRAHHYAYELAHAPLPASTLLMHTCDTPACVRPEHLRIGTQRENIADRDAKGRAPRGLRNGAYTRPERVRRGARHGNAKLTDADVIEMRRLARDGERSGALAARFGVDRSRVQAIVSGRAWRHLSESPAEAPDAVV